MKEGSLSHRIVFKSSLFRLLLPESEMAPQCNHTFLSFQPSPKAAVAGHQQRTPHQLATAASLPPQHEYPGESSFPGPLILPGDDLDLDAKQLAQSFRSWLGLKERNQIT